MNSILRRLIRAPKTFYTNLITRRSFIINNLDLQIATFNGYK